MMDMALTSAWLQALQLARSVSYQDFVQAVPQAKDPPDDETLSDVIENALQGAGVQPVRSVGDTISVSTGGATGVSSTQAVDAAQAVASQAGQVAGTTAPASAVGQQVNLLV